MILRFLIFLFLCTETIIVRANCSDPVPGEYLIVTSNPRNVLDLFENVSKKLNRSDVYIYDHKKPKIFSKLRTTINLKKVQQSTLILKLSSFQLEKIKQLKETVITANCYVDPLQFVDSIEQVISEPNYEYQWGLKHLLKNIDLGGVTASKKIRIAVSDTGFDIEHEDLKENLWVNITELYGKDGFDDDKNGCIDDIHGCDILLNNGDVGINTFNSNLVDHGTHVAGIIAAKTGNLLGISGASFNSELMLIRSFSNRKRTTTASLLKSIYYAVDNKADIINCSWGTGGLPTIADYNAFEYARLNDVIVVVAAGNASTYASRTSPAGLSNVLTVGSFNSSLELSTFSNFGDAVDILAPGGDGPERKNDSILSLGAYSKYIYKKGTSMSTPFVTSAIANLKSIYPQLNRNEIINIILSASNKNKVEAFFDPTYRDSINFINLKNALDLAQDYTTGSISEDLSYEPKSLNKPTTSSFQTSLDNSSIDLSLQSAGCSSKKLGSQANPFSSWLLLILPVLLIFIKKKNS